MSDNSEPWWSKGARSVSLDGTTLNAELPDGHGGRKRSSINLDKCIAATKDGTFRCRTWMLLFNTLSRPLTCSSYLS